MVGDTVHAATLHELRQCDNHMTGFEQWLESSPQRLPALQVAFSAVRERGTSRSDVQDSLGVAIGTSQSLTSILLLPPLLPMRLLLLATAALFIAACAVERIPRETTSAHVRVLAVNDVHGHLLPQPVRTAGVATPQLRGGLAELATLVEQRRTAASIFVGVGDLIGAGPLESALLEDEPTLIALGQMGMTLSAMGNHEVDYGLPTLRRLLAGGCAAQGCRFVDPYPAPGLSLLAANVRVTATDATLFAPSAVRTLDGVRVGFIGAAPESTPTMTLAERVAGLSFVGEAPALNAAAADLDGQGVKTIIALVHEGGVLDPARERGGCEGLNGPIVKIVEALDKRIDAVLSAHTHQRYQCRKDGRWVLQGGEYGRALVEMDLRIDRRTGEPLAIDARIHDVDSTALAKDPHIAALIERARAQAQPIAGRKIAELDRPLSAERERFQESPMARVVAEAQWLAMRERGAVIAFTNAGGVRGSLDAGAVSYGDLYRVQPFGNYIVQIELSGAELLELLDGFYSSPSSEGVLIPSSSLAYTVAMDADPGQRVLAPAVRIGGEPLALDGRYPVCFNNFVADGGGRYPLLARVASRPRVGGPLDLEALTDYLGANPDLSHADQQRVSVR